MNKTIHNVIHDCRNGIHFTDKVFDQYFTELDDSVYSTLNILSENIYDRFVQLNRAIDIFSNVNSIVHLSNQTNQKNIISFGMLIQESSITLNRIFDNIIKSNSTLSPYFIQSTMHEVRLLTIKDKLDFNVFSVFILVKILCKESVRINS